MDSLELMNYYHVPQNSKKCSGTMIFKGVGEYQCENCGYVDYDDYGKVRLYIEEHKGATAVEIEAATGVTQRSIRRMLRESRLEIAEGSKIFMHCERCGKEIRSGRFCEECAVKVRKSQEELKREGLQKEKRGYGHSQNGEEGQRRFMRDRAQI